jgi:hypothetical protein
MAKKKPIKVPVLWMAYKLVQGKTTKDMYSEFTISNGILPTHSNQVAALFETIKTNLHSNIKCTVIPVSWTVMRWDEVK